MAASQPPAAGAPQRQPTMADIAAHLGISRQLVSIVLRDAPGASEETRRRVKEAAQELGFSAHIGARQLRRTRSTDLGVVFSPAHPTEHEIVEAIYPAAAERSYDVVLSAQTPTRTTEQCVEELLGHRCAALIVIGSDLAHRDLRRLADRLPVPLVETGHGRRNSSYDVVRSAGDRGIRSVVAHLVGLGHRRICFVDPSAMPPAGVRRRGYERAVLEHRLTADLVEVPGDYREANYFEEAGADAARTLLRRRSLPTAVVVSNDTAAVGALQVFARSGVQVPHDISLTGYDDAPLARLSSVDLTTVRQDPLQMGRQAVAAAFRRIDEPGSAPQERVVATTLVVRGSTAPPRTRG